MIANKQIANTRMGGGYKTIHNRCEHYSWSVYSLSLFLLDVLQVIVIDRWSNQALMRMIKTIIADEVIDPIIII